MNRWLFLAPVLFLVGCGQSSSDPLDKIAYGPGQHPDSFKYLLGSEPADAKDVIALRGDAKDGDAVVVVGRVGGSKQPVIKGRAAFTIVDLSLKPCNPGDEEECFDFACLGKEKVAKASAMVKFVDGQDKTLNVDAHQLLNAPQLEGQIVVVRGVAKRDETNNLTIQANQIYLRPKQVVKATESAQP
ncbi:MAG: hypothetical protein JNM56_39100 [Planctomycetia bacterium]|nr:hypothetical protein [Planctomycetia bacterium]